MKSKQILCFLVIGLCISSTGIASAFVLVNDQGNMGKWNITTNDPIPKSFENPVRVDASALNQSWQSVVDESIRDINSRYNSQLEHRANFAYEHRDGDPEENKEVVITAGNVTPYGPFIREENNETVEYTPLAITNYTRRKEYDSKIRTNYWERLDIVIDITTWGNAWSPPRELENSFDLKSVVSHELGHAAGLYHVPANQTRSVMRTPLSVNTQRHWDIDDVDGLIAIYGIRIEENTGETDPGNGNNPDPSNNSGEGESLSQTDVDIFIEKENLSLMDTINKFFADVNKILGSIGNSINNLFRIGFVVISNANSNPTEPYDVMSHKLYPYYTYDELQDGSPFIVSGQIISISESKWSTSDGKKPKGIVITRGEDESGPYTEYNIDIKRDEFVYTDVVLKINTIYKGDLNEEEIVVRFLTGTADNWRMSDEPGLDIQSYEEGKTYLFFLAPHETYLEGKVPNHYRVLTPRGALMEQQSFSANMINIFMNQNQKTFVNFDGDQFTPKNLIE